VFLCDFIAHKYVTLSWCTALQAGRSRVRFPIGICQLHYAPAAYSETRSKNISWG